MPTAQKNGLCCPCAPTKPGIALGESGLAYSAKSQYDVRFGLLYKGCSTTCESVVDVHINTKFSLASSGLLCSSQYDDWLGRKLA